MRCSRIGWGSPSGRSLRSRIRSRTRKITSKRTKRPPRYRASDPAGGQAFGADVRRDSRNAGGEGFEKLHTNAGAVKDRADEDRVPGERGAEIFHKSEALNGGAEIGEGVTGRRIGPDDDEPRAGADSED